MSSTPPDPFPDITRVPLVAGTEIHRVHDRGHACDSFNPGKGRPTRFAPLVRADGTHVPTAYGAQSFECAVHETIFHEIQHDAPRKTIRFSAIEPLAYARLALTRDITLCALFEPDLNAWGLRRADLIDTPASEYHRTARWALAIHHRWPDVDGLTWTSKRCDPHTAYMLFGDRLAPSDMLPLEQVEIANSNDHLLLVRHFGARARIVITL